MLLLFLPRRIQVKLKQNRTLLWLVELLVMMLLTCIAFAVGFKYSEDVPWEEAIWQVWQTITTVGYGNRPAQTSVGRWATMLIGLLGIAMLGTTISAVFTWREEVRMRRRLGLLSNPASNGYVFFHFPGEAKLLNIITQIRAVEEEIPICLVCNILDELPVSLAGFRNIHFVKGSMLNRTTYERANLSQSKAVVVFPRQSGVDESDAITKVVVDLASQFIGPQTNLIHFLVNPDNAWMFKETRSRPILEHLEIFALVQECQDKGTASLVQRLLLNTAGANPETFVPQRIVGWTWRELQLHAMQVSQDIQTPVSLFALIRGETPDPCPAYHTVIQQGDLISLITYSHLDWDAFERRLDACKR